MKRITFIFLLSALLIIPARADDAPFYFGVDLSYVNEMEDCGAVYREQGEPRDPFALFADHGATLVRARLWHNPDWTDYSTLADVKRTFQRARDAGMATLLDIHYSDDWADPGNQTIPAAWQDLDDAQLVDAVYDYTYDVLTELHTDDLAPAFVQVGNETNGGILKRGSAQNWSRDAALFTAGIRAVRAFSAETNTDPQIILHVAQPENTDWWFSQAEAVGITDFDVIGVSYYPQWSSFTIADTGAQINALRRRFGKDVMIVEAAYPWTRAAADESAGNILTQGLRGYPVTPQGQRQFMTDLTQSLISNGGLGIVYWEPAWVSTDCFTRWGQGSHWENATFFDFQHENALLEGIDFLRDDYLHPASLADGVIEPEYGDPLVEDSMGDSLDGTDAFDLTGLYARSDADMLRLALSIAGDIYDERGSYLIYIDTTNDAQGADVDVGRRPITVADPYKPEFRLDVVIRDVGDTVSASYALHAWIDGEWQDALFTGGAAIYREAESVIEVLLARVALGDPVAIRLTAIGTDRARVHTAGDILGDQITPGDWSDPVVLSAFRAYEFSN